MWDRRFRLYPSETRTPSLALEIFGLQTRLF